MFLADQGFRTRGYFYNIKNIPLSQEEKELDYGFYKYLYRPENPDGMCDAWGKRINKNPYFKSLYAATTLYGVSPEIKKYIIAEPELLPKNGLYG